MADGLGGDVVNILDELRLFKEAIPRRIQVENGSEFISKAMDKWAYDHEVTLDFSRPGKTTDNPYIESFNGSTYSGLVIFCTEIVFTLTSR